MARFLAHLKIHIQAAFTSSVLVVHHTGKDVTKGSRGGSSIEANADCVFTLKRDESNDEHRVTLHCKHTKDSERPPEIILKAAYVELGYKDSKGYPVTSLILNMELSAMEQTVLTMTEAGKSQRFIAEKLNKSKTTVGKTQVRLRAKNLLSSYEKMTPILYQPEGDHSTPKKEHFLGDHLTISESLKAHTCAVLGGHIYPTIDSDQGGHPVTPLYKGGDQ